MVIERLHTAAQFESLRGAWQDLLSDSACSNPFLTWEWLEAWWRRFGDKGQLTLLAGWSGERLDLLAPFMARRRQISRGKPWGVLEVLGTGSVGSDYLDVVLRRGTEQVGLDRLAAHLQAEPALLTLPRVHAEAARVWALSDRLVDAGWRAHVRPASVCPYITLASHTWESFLDGLGRDHRANVRRRLRKLHARFDVRFDRADTDEQREAALATLVRLHEMRWRSRGGSTAFHTPGLRAFHEEFTRRALEQGWLRLFVLRLNGCPAAALYGLRVGDTFYFYQSGFDPRFADHGVGLVTMALAIRHALEDGAAEYDFLHGAEPYKFLWTQQVRALNQVELYPPTARGLVSMHLTELSRLARNAVRRIAWHPATAETGQLR